MNRHGWHERIYNHQRDLTGIAHPVHSAVPAQNNDQSNATTDSEQEHSTV